MDKCFLSYSFGSERDRRLVRHADRLIESHDIRTVDGEYLAGQPLTDEIRHRIGECDGLVAILTRRDGEEQTEEFSLWVQNELVIARALERPAIALIEQELDVGGAFADREHVVLDPGDPGPAFVKLSQTLGQWRRRSGRWVKVNLQPSDLARQLGRDGGICEYRLSRMPTGEEGDWSRARVKEEIGGTFAYLSGVFDDHLIELRARSAGQEWYCPAVPQQLLVHLERV